MEHESSTMKLKIGLPNEVLELLVLPGATELQIVKASISEKMSCLKVDW